MSLPAGKTKVVRLHLGCARKRLDGWVNVDIDPNERVDLICDVSKLSAFGDGTVDEIYACHILEHFGRAKVVPVLCEWNRVLKVGGTLRVAVPDFESCVQLYLKRRSDLFQLAGLLHGGQQNQYDYHHIAFDLQNMADLLSRCGFKDTTRYKPEDFLPKGFDDFSLAYLPHNDRNGTLMSLNVTAIKSQHTTPILDTFLTQLIGKKLIPNALKLGHIKPPTTIPASIKVKKGVATGFGDRLGMCLMYAGLAYAINGEVHVPWDSKERAWGPTCLHGGWPSDLTTIRKYITFPKRMLLSDEKKVAELPETVLDWNQDGVLVGSILPTVGGPLIHQYPQHPQFDAKQYYTAYRQACKEMVITHPIVATLPKYYVAVHVRGGDKHDADSKFIQTTSKVIQQLKTIVGTVIAFRLVTDDAGLAKKIQGMEDFLPLPVEVPGLESTLRDFAVLVHASLIVQHSPNGWSAFSHVASCLREIPIINTCPGPEHANFMAPFIKAGNLPSFFYHHLQSQQFFNAAKLIPWTHNQQTLTVTKPT
jgi:predicted SAM-dependent methyltransferase